MFKKTIKHIVRFIYHKLPFSQELKIRLKSAVYRVLSPLIKNTNMYRVWESAMLHGRSVHLKMNQEDNKSSSDERKFISHLYRSSNNRDDDYVEYVNDYFELKPEDVKLIAFYLPQFHPISENDAWWGKGFTEWSNVTKALPQFIGHYQPQLPIHLGFYDLRVKEIMKEQVNLAKQYGVFGFCFYFYWFHGKRLLELPVDQFISNNGIDFPFCLCWANENWTRTWDGQEKEVLQKQRYSDEDDKNLIIELSRYLKDKRYIRVNNKPLLIVYRPGIIPNMKERSTRWREYCEEIGIGPIHLLGVKAWGVSDPKEYGLDGLLEFPPHTMNEYGCEVINDKVNVMNPDFQGIIFNYKKFVEDGKYLSNISYPLYKTVCPSWDNTARRPNNSTIFYGSSPQIYKTWLKNVIHWTNKTFKEKDRFVFINAWNEWGEGAHLEPDRKYGYAYLQATKDALLESRPANMRKLIYVSHDANNNGAQILSLNIIRSLKENFGFDIAILCKEEGPLLSEFEKFGSTFLLSRLPEGQKVQDLIENLAVQNYRLAICNTVITGDILKYLTLAGIKSISLIHELPGVIRQYNAEEFAAAIGKHAHKIVFPSHYVYKKFQSIIDVEKEKCVIRPQGLYNKSELNEQLEEARIQLRKSLKIPLDSKIVLAVGYGDHRKGVDYFCDVAQRVGGTDDGIYFVWVGNIEPSMFDSLSPKEKQHVLWVPFTHLIGEYYAGADLYLMTSREDPFPSVVLEAMDVGLPVVGFQDAGGFCDIVTDSTGGLVEYGNTKEMSEKVLEIVKDDEKREMLGKNGHSLIENNFYFEDYIFYLLDLLDLPFKKVSVLVPNYNYERYISKRLDSIFSQTYPIYELVFLDDCSKDDSINAYRKYMASHNTRRVKVKSVVNLKNSGSVFKQWIKGILLTSGDYIWIAEADDLCVNTFLQEVTKGFYLDEQVTLCYTQSKQIDEYDNVVSGNYYQYTNDIDQAKWHSSYIRTGLEEIKDTLVIKNTIPNVSAVVFKKDCLTDIDSTLLDYRVAGDWAFYISILENGKIFYNHLALNYHRRHKNSVVGSRKDKFHFDEIIRVQNSIIENFDIQEKVLDKVYKYREFLEEYLNVKL